MQSMGMDLLTMRTRIEGVGGDPADVRGNAGKVVDEIIAALDEGALRVCEPIDGAWVTHSWIKQAILLYFQRLDNVEVAQGNLPLGDAHALRGTLPSYHDKLPTKRNYKQLGARCVPPG